MVALVFFQMFAVADSAPMNEATSASFHTCAGLSKNFQNWDGWIKGKMHV